MLNNLKNSYIVETVGVLLVAPLFVACYLPIILVGLSIQKTNDLIKNLV